MAARYNPPPNWPRPPAGWRPEPGWKPDPAWGPVPPNWQLWVDDGSQTYGLSSAEESQPQANWFLRHKILSVIGALLVVVIVASALGGGDDGSTDPVAQPEQTVKADASIDASTPAPQASTPAPSAPAESEAQETAPPVDPPPLAGPRIGTAVRDGKFEFTVTRIERGLTTVGEGFLAEEAQGEFVIIYINVSNIGDEGQMLSSLGQVLYDIDGRKFEPSNAIFSLPDADKFFLENINPGNSITDAPLLFDVPTDVKLATIELHDSFLSAGVEVALE